MLTNFLTAMTGIILKNGGTIDKYMGDCIMAFWNAPLDNPEHKKLDSTICISNEKSS